MDRSSKAKLKEELTGLFNKANGAIIAEYRGLTVGEITDLRRALKAAKSDFRVLKNRVAKKAIDDGAKESAALTPALKGPVGVAFCYGDAAQAAKAMFKFETEHEKFSVKAGLFDGALVNKADLKAISDLPSREVLVAKILGSITSPHRNLLGVLTGVQRNLVQVINAIKDKKAQ